jgi:prepilin-type N-terminal cleavage/methylation domain-containing protein
MSHKMIGRHPASRSGMTLIEVMIALVILSGSLIAMGNFMGKFAHAQRRAGIHADAVDLASDVMDSVQHDSSYAAIPGDFARTVTISRDGASFTRTTAVKQIGGAVTSNVNYYIVTSTVVNTNLVPADTVRKSIVIRSF